MTSEPDLLPRAMSGVCGPTEALVCVGVHGFSNH